MKLWAALSNAVAGWMLILRNDASWRDKFALTMPGLTTAIIIFLFCAFLAVAMASTYQGMPDIFGLFDALLAQLIWVGVVWVSVRITAAILRSPIDNLAVMIPVLYLLIGYLLLGSFINLIMPLAVVVLTIALVYPFYHLGRMAAGWPAPNAAMFAVLTVALLVGIPWALYIVGNFAGSPS